MPDFADPAAKRGQLEEGLWKRQAIGENRCSGITINTPHAATGQVLVSWRKTL